MYVDAKYANEETVAVFFFFVLFGFFPDGGQMAQGGVLPPAPPSALSITSSPLAPLTIPPPSQSLSCNYL